MKISDMISKEALKLSIGREVASRMAAMDKNAILPLTEEEMEAYMFYRQNSIPVPTAQDIMTNPAPSHVNSTLDIQVGGDHYKRFGDMQPWQVFGRWMNADELRGHAKGTAIAYLSRDKENAREDIEKAIHTLQLYLEISAKEGKE